jgi:hypothetical protein
MMDKEINVIQKPGKKMNTTQKLLVLAVLSIVLLGIGAQILEARACERAFVNCMDEPLMQGNMLWIIYCGNGYAFCLKYID